MHWKWSQYRGGLISGVQIRGSPLYVIGTFIDKSLTFQGSRLEYVIGTFIDKSLIALSLVDGSFSHWTC